MIAALAADQLERACVAAFHPAVHDPGRLAPEVRGPAVAGLASKWERRASLDGKAQPRVTGHGAVRAVQGGHLNGQATGPWSCVVSGVPCRHPDRPFQLLLPPSVPCPLVVIAICAGAGRDTVVLAYSRCTSPIAPAFCTSRHAAHHGL
jgi:hypothetical protein